MSYHVRSIERNACLFIAEPPQLASKPEEKHHTGKPDRNRNSGESGSCHPERVLAPVLQVAGILLCCPPCWQERRPLKRYRQQPCFLLLMLQAAHQGCKPPGDLQERCSREAVGQLQRANQAAPPQETGGQLGPQPQSLPGLHLYPQPVYFCLSNYLLQMFELVFINTPDEMHSLSEPDLMCLLTVLESYPILAKSKCSAPSRDISHQN